ncbi:MAG TPA: cyclic nucleotide-binding domain-containing protein [Pyrinomonadaceae bacterium]|jgi:Fe-S-cluster-containing dehydrogenase component/CRP-like cAMP-binding protein
MSRQQPQPRREVEDHALLLNTISKLDLLTELTQKHDGHYKHELELELVVYGRTYTGGRVGPYAHLWDYAGGAEVIREGDWAGNSFYILVAGTLHLHRKKRVDEVRVIMPGEVFGEMAIIEGDPRSATVKVPDGKTARVLELQRPALRLLRKLPEFARVFNEHYHRHGRAGVVSHVRDTCQAFTPDLLKRLEQVAHFRVYGRPHTLFQQGQPLTELYLINKGWVEVTRGGAAGAAFRAREARYLGAGNCLGLEAFTDGAETWPYGVTIQARTEVLVIPIADLQADVGLREVLLQQFAGLSEVDQERLLEPIRDPLAVAATEKEISTGLVDGTNLLVMDMDLCVRCGNCSLACHQVHGRSRLLRRGIEIERPRRPQSQSLQHLLAPSVCLHCQDPECLTGCPTGAIGRHPGGEIDIDPKTCIGCGDCATQCPYNAISLVPKRAPDPPGRLARLYGLLRITPAPLPPRVDDAESYLAVKCNLCNNTPLNPAGAKTHAYSCEENCPTGALLRVSPLAYFGETSAVVGKAYYDGQTHVTGRNIHQDDPVARRWHRAGVAALVLTIAALAWAGWRYDLDQHLWATRATVRWLTGFAGLFGVLAAVSYLVRKQVYRRRAKPLRYWLLAHAYVGVLAALALLVHGGWHAGGLLTSLLMVSFDLVLLSGLFGVATYVLIPRLLTRIEEEPLLLDDLRARRDELRRALALIETKDARLRAVITKTVPRRLLSLRYLLAQYFDRRQLTQTLAAARKRFDADAERLQLGQAERQLLAKAVDTTALLRRVDALIYLHLLLKLWVAPHVVATVLMLLLMTAHVFQVFYFAAH